MKNKIAKPAAAKPAIVAPSPRVGTREFRDAQRAEFNARFDAQKKKG